MIADLSLIDPNKVSLSGKLKTTEKPEIEFEHISCIYFTVDGINYVQNIDYGYGWPPVKAQQDAIKFVGRVLLKDKIKGAITK